MITYWRIPRVIVVLSIAAFIIAWTSLLGSAADEKNPADPLPALLRRIEVLENRVGVLDQLTRNAQSSREVPSDWSPFEFNGRTYYVVPVATTSAPPAKVTFDSYTHAAALIFPQLTQSSR